MPSQTTTGTGRGARVFGGAPPLGGRTKLLLLLLLLSAKAAQAQDPECAGCTQVSTEDDSDNAVSNDLGDCQLVSGDSGAVCVRNEYNCYGRSNCASSETPLLLSANSTGCTHDKSMCMTKERPDTTCNGPREDTECADGYTQTYDAQCRDIAAPKDRCPFYCTPANEIVDLSDCGECSRRLAQLLPTVTPPRFAAHKPRYTAALFDGTERKQTTGSLTSALLSVSLQPFWRRAPGAGLLPCS